MRGVKKERKKHCKKLEKIISDLEIKNVFYKQFKRVIEVLDQSKQYTKKMFNEKNQ